MKNKLNKNKNSYYKMQNEFINIAKKKKYKYLLKNT